MEQYLAYIIVTLVIFFMFLIVILSYYSMKREKQKVIERGEIRTEKKIVLNESELSKTELKEYLKESGVDGLSDEDLEKLMNGESIKIVEKKEKKRTVEPMEKKDSSPYRIK